MEEPSHCGIVSEAWPPTAGPGALVTVMGERAGVSSPTSAESKPGGTRWAGSVGFSLHEAWAVEPGSS